jgi:chromosomal replication initiation ATPase DnaA
MQAVVFRAQEAVARPARSPARRSARVRAIMQLVARYMKVDADTMLAPSRCKERIARARQVAMYLTHTTQEMPMSEVAEAFGRDRTTVSYACHLVEDMRDDQKFDAMLIGLEDRIAELGGA